MVGRRSDVHRTMVAAACVCFLVAGVEQAAAGARKGTDEYRAEQGAKVSQKRGHEVRQTARGEATSSKHKGEETSSSDAPPPKIVGGTVAPAGAYPFFVSVKRASDNFAFCGGTLVSSVWVLTAAHCVDGGVTAASLKLVIGAYQLDNEAPGDVRSVTSIHLHPSWNPSTFDNDVALLRLTTASTKSWARMAEPVDPVNPGNTVRAIGHGHTSQGGVASNDLRHVDLPIQSDATMSDPAVYGSSFHGSVMLGAGPLAGGQDTCQGDSGGPLFVPGGQVRLVGNTSWGSGCAQPNKPGIYGEVYQGALRTFVNGLVGRPANDNFAGSGISGPDGTVFGNNTDATGQTGEPFVAGSSADTTVWYSWIAPESGLTTFNLRDAAFDTTLAVFTGNSFGTLGFVASNDDTNGVTQSKVAFNATAGTVYRIAVDGFSAAYGLFALQYAQNPPAHDSFGSPKALTGATGKDFSSSARSTGEPGEPNHGSVPDRSVWFTWTAPQSGTASFNTRESNFDTVLAAYTGTAITGLTQVAFNDQFNGANQSKVTFRVRSGTTYRIAVDGFGAVTGTVGLQWTIAAPANDNFASATTLPSPYFGTRNGTTVRATGEPGELDYHGGAAADNSVWYTWTPSFSAPSVVRLRNLAGLSSGLAVYTGTALNDLTTVAQGSTSAAFSAVAGTTYRIAVDGNGGTTGAFQLEYIAGTCNNLNATMFADGGTTTGTPGDDVIVGSTVSDTINGGGGNDTICSLSGNDIMSGDAGNDTMLGNAGADWFREGSAASGADRMYGQGDRDVVLYNHRKAAVRVTIDGLANDGADGERDLVATTNEVVYGGLAGDALQGGTGDEELRGNGGGDALRGGGGKDTLIGGPGGDRLFGQAGNDILDLVDGVNGNDHGDGGADTDTATKDTGDTVVNVP